MNRRDFLAAALGLTTGVGIMTATPQSAQALALSQENLVPGLLASVPAAHLEKAFWGWPGGWGWRGGWGRRGGGGWGWRGRWGGWGGWGWRRQRWCYWHPRAC